MIVTKTKNDAAHEPLRLLEQYEERDVGAHIFFKSLQAAPVDLGAIWILMANLRAGISGHFVTWLAMTIARIEDPEMRSLLAKQLNDELGSGHFDQIHSHLLDRFISGLDPWKPQDVAEEEMLWPGRRLADEGARPFRAADVYEGVGALMVGEIFAKKMDRCLADEIRRQQHLSEDVLTWLVIHETLEVDHAGDSHALADLVSDDESTFDAIRRGAADQWDSLWRFLDGVDVVKNARRVR